MSTHKLSKQFRLCGLLVALAAWPLAANAQVPVAEIEPVDNLQSVSASELETLVGPIALYPDDLLAIVLPAATFPLQIVEAQRFLQALENDASLQPDEDWDDSVVALLNYPEVIDLLNEDLDWAWRLGEAVVAQQEDVITAIEVFRDRAYDAGNLKSDDYQLVAHEGSTIQITPVQEDVIYVPYYEPERVIVYQPRPVYYYYPRAYPVYYYPYPEYHPFHTSFFWGVTTAFSIGWHSHHLNVFHHSYYGHPYYGRSYWDRGWYRRPNINVYNTVYVRNNVNVNNNRNRDGDRWQSNGRRPVRASDQSIARTRYYPNSSSQGSGSANVLPSSSRSGLAGRSGSTGNTSVRNAPDREARQEIKFRERSDKPSSVATRPAVQPRTSNGQSARRQPQAKPSTTIRQPQARPSTTIRQPQAKPSTTIRQPQAKPSTTIRQPQARPSTTIRQPQARPSTTIRQPQAKQTAPRQTQVRQSTPRPAQTRSAPQPRQSAPSVSSQRQSTARAAAPSKPSRSSSGNSSSKSSGSSARVSRGNSRKSDRD